MEVHTHSLRKNLYRLTIFTVICLCVFSIFKTYAQESPFRILGISQNDENPAIVGVRISGIFEEEDVISVYTNETFIKAKVIGAEDTVTGDALLIENISVDVFQSGENSIVARLERRGIEVAETPIFELIIQGAPLQPALTVDQVSDDEGRISVIATVTGVFLEGDEVILRLNEQDIYTHAVTPDETNAGTVVLPEFEEDILVVGDNVFSAFTRRGRYESQQTTIPEPIVRTEPDVLPEEPEPETALDDVILTCAAYNHIQTATAENLKGQARFGISVDASLNHIVSGTEQHEAYLFTGSDDTWELSDSIVASDYQQSGSQKTVSVVSGDDIFIGTPSLRRSEYQSGAVFGYQPTALAVPTSIFESSNPGAYDQFGSSIAVRNNLLVAASSARDLSGYVTVFSRVDNQWYIVDRIVPSDTVERQRFGRAVAISEGGSIVVGAPGDQQAGIGRGAVYVYSGIGEGRTEQKLVPADTTRNTFGSTLFVGNGVLFIGAPKEGAGAVYVYTKQGSQWLFQERIAAPEGYGDVQRFGADIAAGRGLLIIGAPGADSGHANKTGAVFTYTANPTWMLADQITHTATGTTDQFGEQVAFAGKTLVVGAPGTDAEVQGTVLRNVGALYIYSVTPSECSEELMADETAFGPESIADRAMLLQTLQTSAQLIFDQVTQQIEGAIEDVERAENRQAYALFIDEESAHPDAQKRAAELRGLFAPGLPKEVLVRRVTADQAHAELDDQEMIRGRDAVIDETRENLGVVVPTEGSDLRVGSQSEEVYRLQVFLNENGYPVARFGVGSPGNEGNLFGPSTERALKSFQVVNGIPVTGVLDRQTRNTILTYTSSL